MSNPAEREVARFLAAVQGKMSSRAVSASAFELADELAPDPQARKLLWDILKKGAEAMIDV